MFDATSAGAHIHNNAILQKDGKKVIDLTPAAIGPFTIPVINGDANHRRAQRQHGDLRRPGDDPDGLRRARVRPSA